MSPTAEMTEMTKSLICKRDALISFAHTFTENLVKLGRFVLMLAVQNKSVNEDR